MPVPVPVPVPVGNTASGTVRRGVAHGTAGARVTVDLRGWRPYVGRTPNRSHRTIGRPASTASSSRERRSAPPGAIPGAFASSRGGWLPTGIGTSRPVQMNTHGDRVQGVICAVDEEGRAPKPSYRRPVAGLLMILECTSCWRAPSEAVPIRRSTARDISCS